MTLPRSCVTRAGPVSPLGYPERPATYVDGLPASARRSITGWSFWLRLVLAQELRRLPDASGINLNTFRAWLLPWSPAWGSRSAASVHGRRTWRSPRTASTATGPTLALGIISTIALFSILARCGVCRTGDRWIGVVAGVICVAISIVDILYVISITTEMFNRTVGAQVGWCLWLTGLSSAVLCVTGLTVAKRTRRK